MNRTLVSRAAKLSLIGLILAFLAGCAATHTAISKRKLDVQTRTSTAIFIEPVSRDKRTIYLDVKSGVMEFDRRTFKQAVKENFAEFSDTGYQIIDDPEKAQYTMIAYVLNLEKTSPSAAEAALKQGYMGGAVAAGAGVGAVTTNSWKGGVIGGVAGGAAELISGAFVKDVTYMLVCDIQIKERARDGVYVRKDSKVDTKISDAGSSRQTYSEVTDKKEYRTRIVTTANKVNLKLETAADLMYRKTAYAITGFF